jgi:hypothetical protein
MPASTHSHLAAPHAQHGQLVWMLDSATGQAVPIDLGHGLIQAGGQLGSGPPVAGGVTPSAVPGSLTAEGGGEGGVGGPTAQAQVSRG